MPPVCRRHVKLHRVKGSDRLRNVVELSMQWSFERRICAQTQDLQIFKKFNMSQMNPKEVFHNTAYSVQLLRTRSLPLMKRNIEI